MLQSRTSGFAFCPRRFTCNKSTCSEQNWHLKVSGLMLMLTSPESCRTSQNTPLPTCATCACMHLCLESRMGTGKAVGSCHDFVKRTYGWHCRWQGGGREAGTAAPAKPSREGPSESAGTEHGQVKAAAEPGLPSGDPVAVVTRTEASQAPVTLSQV